MRPGSWWRPGAHSANACGQRPAAAPTPFDIGSELGISVRNFVSHHYDGQVFYAAPQPLRHQSNNSPVKPDRGAVGGVFVGKQVL